jgi:hypothetical protein
MAGVLALTGCATPQGKAFTTPAVVATGQAQVYLYRKSALYAGGQSFTVWMDKALQGELANGSYMLFTVPPGQHTLSVKPGAFGTTYDHSFEITANTTQYVEFELPTFILGNAFHLGSKLAPREAGQAHTDMQGLVGMK